jgi:hypothetical protein
MSMERAPEELDFMQFGTLKMIFMEQVPHATTHFTSSPLTAPSLKRWLTL